MTRWSFLGMKKWLTDAARQSAPHLARLAAQVLLTTAVSAGLLSAACAADVQLLLHALKPFGL